VVFQDGPPARGDLATNLLLGATLLWLVRRLAPAASQGAASQAFFALPLSLARRSSVAALFRVPLTSPCLAPAGLRRAPRARRFCALSRIPLTSPFQPLSLAAVGRALWVNYKITDKRVSVTSTSPFGGAASAAGCWPLARAVQSLTPPRRQPSSWTRRTSR